MFQIEHILMVQLNEWATKYLQENLQNRLMKHGMLAKIST